MRVLKIRKIKMATYRYTRIWNTKILFGFRLNLWKRYRLWNYFCRFFLDKSQVNLKLKDFDHFWKIGSLSEVSFAQKNDLEANCCVIFCAYKNSWLSVVNKMREYVWTLNQVINVIKGGGSKRVFLRAISWKGFFFMRWKRIQKT